MVEILVPGAKPGDRAGGRDKSGFQGKSLEIPPPRAPGAPPAWPPALKSRPRIGSGTAFTSRLTLEDVKRACDAIATPPAPQRAPKRQRWSSMPLQELRECQAEIRDEIKKRT